MDLAPIGLFVYNRLDHARRALNALAENDLSAGSDLFIFSDAPKKPEAAEAVREVREYIRTVNGFRSVRIVERDRNLGLAASIMDGVARLCDGYGRAIVLEDDLLAAPGFLQFMNAALDRFQDEPRVMQISGYLFPVRVESDRTAFFLPLTTSWGWATWRRAWSHFDPSAAGHRVLKRNQALRRAFDLEGAYPYYAMLESQLRGEIDSWAIRWYLSVFLRQGLVLYPPRTLIDNIGFDGSGTHCGKRNGTPSRTAEAEPMIEQIVFPGRTSPSAFNQRAVTDFLRRSNATGIVQKLRGLLR